MLTVFTMFLIYVLCDESLATGILLAGMILFIPLDLLRQRLPGLNESLIHLFRPIIRESEVNRLAGTTFLLVGVAVLVLAFPRPVVSLTLLFLAFADPAASFVGIRYGKDKIFGHKSVQGFVAAYVVCFVCSLAYLLFMGFAWDRIIFFSLLAGLVGALSELVPIGKLDDNLTLPVLSAIGLSLLFYLFRFTAPS